MVQYDKMILNRLLDTYEASLLSTGENRRKIHRSEEHTSELQSLSC